MTKPIIGITAPTAKNPRDGEPHARFALNREYAEWVIKAGGTPLILPAGIDVNEVAHLIDGWLIPGGDDLDSKLWGEPLHPDTDLEYPGRWETEIELWKTVDQSLPVLGICYGCQLLNILHGGSLHQHLPDLLGHNNHVGDSVEEFSIDPGSKLATILGQSASGKSWHHQANKTVGEGLIPVAHHKDGTIEAIEGTGKRWLIGVQWHPERSDSPATPKLFAAFIQAAREFKATR